MSSPGGGATRGGMGGGDRPPSKKLAVYETKLAKIRLPKILKIALCRVRPPRRKTHAAPLGLDNHTLQVLFEKYVRFPGKIKIKFLSFFFWSTTSKNFL